MQGKLVKRGVLSSPFALCMIALLCCLSFDVPCAIANDATSQPTTEGIWALYYKDGGTNSEGQETYHVVVQTGNVPSDGRGEPEAIEDYTDGCENPVNNEALCAQRGRVRSVSIKEGTAPRSTAYWFSNFSNCTSIDLRGLNTAQTTTMSGMFGCCYSLKHLDLSPLKTGSVKDMSNMFHSCGFDRLDVSTLDTTSVETMDSMFYGCPLSSLDLSTFNTKSVKSMAQMFTLCVSLKTVNVSSFNTSSVTNMASMFYTCEALEEVDLSSFDTSKVSNFSGMFQDCFKLQKVKLGSKFVFGSQGEYSTFSLSWPYDTFISGADGKWYSAATRAAFKSYEIPSGIADTYVASKNLLPAKPAVPSGQKPQDGSHTQTPPVILAKINLSNATVKMAASKTYTGRKIEPTVKVTLGGRTLKAGADYVISYRNNKSVGSAAAIITGKGAYAGTKTATFQIVPKATGVSKLTAAKKALTVKWKKPSKAALKQTTGYQVRYSLKKSMKSAKTKTVKATTSAGKKCQLKVSKLKAKKKYYVQVRAYKKVGKATYYSSWSKAKAVKTK